VTAWLRHHGTSFVQTVARLAQAPAATALNVLVIGVALALPLGGYCLLANVEMLAGNVSTEPQMSVFLAADTTRREVTGIEEHIRGARGVKTLRFVSRDSALSELKRDPAMAELASALRDNPLPDAFVVSLADGDAQTVEQLQQDLAALPKVAHVQIDSAWVQRLEAVLRLGRTTVALLAALLCLALVAVTFNTIRLQILTQSEEIEVSRLVGATDAYVRRPFFYLGSLLGVLGGGAALVIVFAAMAVLNRDLGPLGVLYGTALHLRPPGWRDSALALGLSAALGWLGAYISVSRHLRTSP
jgi:cell division transport system permease protein